MSQMEESIPPDGIIITAMRAEHLDDLAELERLVFSRPWSYDGLAQELHNPLAVFFVAQSESSGRSIGYMGMHHILNECALSNIAVHPDYRRRGIASALMQNALKYAKLNRVSRLTLEVRLSNTPAISLYRRFGFKCDGIRPGFYDSPKEDAAIYSLYL